MPCSDVTEVLRLRVDDAERLAGYQFRKRTCGRAVGEESLLEALLAGLPAASILAYELDAFADENPTASDEEMFLQLKHLLAVQAGLRALLGHASAGASDPVRVARVATEDGGVLLEAELSVDVITEQIKACGRCKGCAALR